MPSPEGGHGDDGLNGDPLSAYDRSKFELEIRALEQGRTSKEQFLAEAETAGNHAFIGGEVTPRQLVSGLAMAGIKKVVRGVQRIARRGEQA